MKGNKMIYSDRNVLSRKYIQYYKQCFWEHHMMQMHKLFRSNCKSSKSGFKLNAVLDNKDITTEQCICVSYDGNTSESYFP